MAVSGQPDSTGLTRSDGAEAAAAGKDHGENAVPDGISFGRCFAGAFSCLAVRLLIISVLFDIVGILLGMLEITPPFGSYMRMYAAAAAAVILTFTEAALRYGPQKTLRKAFCPYPKGKYKVSQGMDKISEIPACGISVGDVVFLEEGDIVPADGILIDGSIKAGQYVFGDKAETEKTAAPYGYGKSVSGLKDPYSVFAGSAVTSGRASMLTAAVGKDTVYAGKIGEFPCEISENSFSVFKKTAAAVGIISAAAAMILLLLSGISEGNALGGAVSGLSAMSSVLAAVCAGGRSAACGALAAGSVRYLEKCGVFVNSGECLVNAGKTDMIMTERAGMITSGEFAFSGFIDGTGREYHSFSEMGDRLAKLVRTAVLSTANGSGGMDKALTGTIGKDAGNMPKKQAETSENGVCGVTVTADNRLLTVIKADADNVLDLCGEYLDAGGKKHRFTNKDAVRKLTDTLQLGGKDIAAFAFTDKSIKGGKLPADGYVLICFAVLQDGYPEEAAGTVEKLEKMGVRTVLVTSAARMNTIFTVKFAGIKKSGRVIIDRGQLEKMNGTELGERLENIGAAAGLSDKEKTRLAKAAVSEGKNVMFACCGNGDKAAAEESAASFASPAAPQSLSAACGAYSEGLGIAGAERLISVSRRFSGKYRAFIIIRMLAAALICAAALLSGW